MRVITRSTMVSLAALLFGLVAGALTDRWNRRRVMITADLLSAAVVASVPLNVAQATLGSKITVKTLDGTKVAVRIPAGTAAGRRFRVRGQGIAKGENRGDLIVETTITVPESLNEEQQRLMREFAEAGGLKY